MLAKGKLESITTALGLVYLCMNMVLYYIVHHSALAFPFYRCPDKLLSSGILMAFFEL